LSCSCSQGRLPIRVQLAALTEQDLRRILTETKFNLVEQQVCWVLFFTVRDALWLSLALVKDLRHVGCRVASWMASFCTCVLV
jgi:ATP-dependent protease HslVU (ClpYQ) ATPase subunit